MDIQKVWVKVLEEIQSEVGPANLRVYFSQTDAQSSSDGKITLVVPSAFIEGQLKTRYFDLINSSFEKVTGQKLDLKFKIDSNKLAKKSLQSPNDQDEGFFVVPQELPNTSFLNPKYTLESFVVGPSNNLAFAAAQAVVQNPGTSYNPLFIYGGTGVGKTHLMVAIGNALLKKNPNSKVIYCSSEKFMNDYVTAIKDNRMGDLRARYRLASALIIDDAQFFSGREGTQEEFFHTFNELQAKNAQIVLTSDKAPNEIAKLEDRLKSRFQGGLMVDIQSPDFDTRVAILRAKCLERGDSLPDDSLKLIAGSLDSNLRELEGKLMQIIQSVKVAGLPPTPENISRFLNNYPQSTLTTDYKKVLSSACQYFNLSLKDLIGPKRQKELVLPRHLTMYILSEELKFTVERIGQILGGRDHTTVMHGRDRIKGLINTDREVARMLIEVKSKLFT